MKKLTPILYVDEIEPSLPFWVDRLGFEVTTEVPDEDRLGFVILKKDDVEVMYQTKESVRNDVPALADSPTGGSFLFIEVDDLDAVESALKRHRFSDTATENILRRRRTHPARARRQCGDFRPVQ